MKEPGRDKERLQHIVEAADVVLEHSKGMTFEMFTNDKLRYGAIVYYTMIIGEAGYMLSREFVEKYNEVPWGDIAGMRHHIVHGYYKVDNRVLWNIIKKRHRPLARKSPILSGHYRLGAVGNTTGNQILTRNGITHI